MNKAFKVLWNQVRNTYVVASEAQTTHGKPGKATKTIVAAAVAGLMAMGSSAFASTVIDSSSFGNGEGQYNSTKFISGHGGDISIQTSGDTRKLFIALKNALNDQSVENIKELLGALGTANGQTLLGFAGGTNSIDNQFGTVLLNLKNVVAEKLTDDPDLQKQIANGIERVLGQMSDGMVSEETPNLNHEQSINILIGGNGTNPLLIGTVGSDRLINTSLGLKLNETPSLNSFESNIVRKGNVVITANSGNLFSLVSAGSAINLDGLSANAKYPISDNFSLDATVSLQGGGAHVVLDGRTELNLNHSTSSLGAVAGGSSIAFGGQSSSIVNGSSTINVSSSSQGTGFEGLNVGLIGGGLSVATLGGSSNAIVGDSTKPTETATTINLNSGISGLVMGGGIAAAAEISQVESLVTEIPGIGDNIKFDQELIHKGGTATTESQNININLGSGATVFGLMGGATAVAYQVEDATTASKATASVKDVNITIGEEGKGSAFTKADFTDKSEYFGALKDAMGVMLPDEMPSGGMSGVLDAIKDVVASVSVDANEQKVQQSIDTLAKYPGVTVGVLGGGIAASWAREASGDAASTPIAETTVNSVSMTVHSGYNVGLVGGGLAMASAAESLDGENTVQTAAKAEVTDGVSMLFDGGETVGVMGGGIAVFSGTKEQNNGIGALSTVKSVEIGMTGENTSIDGVVLGGLAIDDTNPTDDGTPTGQPVSTKNASSTVENSATFTADSGKLNRLNFAAFVGQENQAPNDPNADKPDVRDHLDALAYAVDHQNVALIGGGLSSGIHDDKQDDGIAHVATANINLVGNVVVGEEGNKANVYGGGIAANGAKATVESANILVAGNAQVYGDIYGGGIAQDGEYSGDPEYYNKSESVVEKTAITLEGGHVYGNLYAGGLVSKARDNSPQSSSVVEDSTITLKGADIFQGSVIDGSNTGKATLIFANDSFDMSSKQVTAFDVIDGSAQSVTGLAYSFGEKDTTNVLGNVAFSSVTAGGDSKTMNIGTTDRTGVASIKTLTDATTFNVANGLLALNTDSTDAAVSAFAGAGAQNAVYVTGGFNFNESIVTVGDVADATSSGIYVGTNGALIADADGGTTISTVLNMRDGSKVHFADVASASEKGSEVLIDEVNGSFATSVDNVLYTAVRNEGDKVSYTFTQRSEEDLDEVGLGDVDDTEALGDISHQDDDASEYIKGFLDQSNTSIDNTNRSQQINAAMNLAAAAGVQTVAIDSAAMGIDAVAKRASLINDFAEGGVLFAEATGKRFEMGGSSDFGAIKADLGGIVVGGEYTTNDWTFGALANLGTGTVRGQDTNSGVKNDVDYYGVQAYAAKRFGSFNVVGQVGYVTTSNDVSHATAALDKADIDADVMSVGVRGEMRFDLTQNTRLVPYVGVNYLRVSTDGFHTKQGLEVKDQDQDIVTIPVGVKFAGDMQTASGWKWTPSMDIGYVAALGDRDTDARTKVGATTVHTSMDVWSESVVRTSFGLKAQKENWGFGVQAGSALGSDDTQELFGQVRVDYRF